MTIGLFGGKSGEIATLYIGCDIAGLPTEGIGSLSVENSGSESWLRSGNGARD